MGPNFHDRASAVEPKYNRFCHDRHARQREPGRARAGKCLPAQPTDVRNQCTPRPGKPASHTAHDWVIRVG